MNTLLPPSVVQRLQAERERIERGAFSSALNVSETLLARESGYRVLGQVMGASVWQISGGRVRANWRNVNWRDADSPGWRFELTAYTDAMRNVFESALQRLRAEAMVLGADGVIGMRVRSQKPSQLQDERIEFTVIGTAVKRTAMFDISPAGDALFTSNLSGEETWKLERSGYAPCALLFECCALLQTLSGATRAFIMNLSSSGTANYEYQEYTEAIYVARATAMQRLETRAQGVKATGILNVQIELEEHLKVDPKLPGVNPDTPHQVFALIAQGTAICALPYRTANSIETVVSLT